MGSVRAIPGATTNPGQTRKCPPLKTWVNRINSETTISIRRRLPTDSRAQFYAHADGPTRADAIRSDAKCPKRTGNGPAPWNAVCSTYVTLTTLVAGIFYSIPLSTRSTYSYWNSYFSRFSTWNRLFAICSCSPCYSLLGMSMIFGNEKKKFYEV